MQSAAMSKVVASLRTGPEEAVTIAAVERVVAALADEHLGLVQIAGQGHGAGGGAGGHVPLPKARAHGRKPGVAGVGGVQLVKPRAHIAGGPVLRPEQVGALGGGVLQHGAGAGGELLARVVGALPVSGRHRSGR